MLARWDFSAAGEILVAQLQGVVDEMVMPTNGYTEVWCINELCNHNKMNKLHIKNNPAARLDIRMRSMNL